MTGGIKELDGVESINISVDSSIDTTSNGGIIAHHEETEYNFSCGVEIPTREVICPGCNTVNHPPKGAILSFMTEEPFPCVMCGYPLL